MTQTEIRDLGYVIGRATVAADAGAGLCPPMPMATEWEVLEERLGYAPDWYEQQLFFDGYRDAILDGTKA